MQILYYSFFFSYWSCVWSIEKAGKEIDMIGLKFECTESIAIFFESNDDDRLAILSIPIALAQKMFVYCPRSAYISLYSTFIIKQWDSVVGITNLSHCMSIIYCMGVRTWCTTLFNHRSESVCEMNDDMWWERIND